MIIYNTLSVFVSQGYASLQRGNLMGRCVRVLVDIPYKLYSLIAYIIDYAIHFFYQRPAEAPAQIGAVIPVAPTRAIELIDYQFFHFVAQQAIKHNCFVTPDNYPDYDGFVKQLNGLDSINLEFFHPAGGRKSKSTTSLGHILRFEKSKPLNHTYAIILSTLQKHGADFDVVTENTLEITKKSLEKMMCNDGSVAPRMLQQFAIQMESVKKSSREGHSKTVAESLKRDLLEITSYIKQDFDPRPALSVFNSLRNAGHETREYRFKALDPFFPPPLTKIILGYCCAPLPKLSLPEGLELTLRIWVASKYPEEPNLLDRFGFKSIQDALQLSSS